jgi:hypothetical protein
MTRRQHNDMTYLHHNTGAGGDNGIDHHENWLRFPYDSTVLRSHDLHPHPYMWGTAPHHADISPHSPVSIVTNGNLLSTAAAATRGSSCAPPARMLCKHTCSHTRRCAHVFQNVDHITYYNFGCVCVSVCASQMQPIAPRRAFSDRGRQCPA